MQKELGKAASSNSRPNVMSFVFFTITFYFATVGSLNLISHNRQSGTAMKVSVSTLTLPSAISGGDGPISC